MPTCSLKWFRPLLLSVLPVPFLGGMGGVPNTWHMLGRKELWWSEIHFYAHFYPSLLPDSFLIFHPCSCACCQTARMIKCLLSLTAQTASIWVLRSSSWLNLPITLINSLLLLSRGRLYPREEGQKLLLVFAWGLCNLLHTKHQPPSYVINEQDICNRVHMHAHF